ncbi:MAG: hypothetical protein HY920_08375 [Elusimicrobia bacterium]|nr:hypothetical protein [Elusimicrobiota bacterium]
MERGFLITAEAEIKYSLYRDSHCNWLQFYYTITPKHPEPIKEQIRTIELAERELYDKFDIKAQTVAWKRIFSSDLINHYDEIREYKKRQASDFFISVTEQPPISNVKVSLLGFCLNNITDKFRDGAFFYFDTTSGIRHIFAEHLIDPDADEHSNSEKQTTIIFDILKKKLADFNTSIEDGVLRTWLYAPHIDADYPGIVKARKELFEAIGLNQDTHYIASTGIQGGSGNRFARVFMDAYAVTGIKKGLIHYIQALEHLSPTHVYGVTFERATAVELGKTNFLFISGTASIDQEGEVVYPGDIAKQTEHTLKNITALVHAAEFTETDLSHLIIYLRDPADYTFVKPLIDIFALNLPAIYVKACVCRPGWLIEIEAAAAKSLLPKKSEHESR